VRRGYKAFLMGTATDLPTRAIVLSPLQTRAQELFSSIRKWDKVQSVIAH
jgi:hypothetical protein